jgi:putative ABC transport system permease protein
VNFSISVYGGGQVIPVNLTVAGFAHLDDAATAIASGNQYSIMSPIHTVEYPASEMGHFLLISWEKTMQKIFETIQALNPQYRPVDTGLLIYLNRKALINPWDVETSINNINVVENNIVNTISNDLGFAVSIQNNLEWPLRSFQFISMGIRFTFTIVSLPIFFVAWYMGRTVSDVSFNLRRREIGLLSTKGFSRGQILRTFLTETMLIGSVGGILGVFLGFLLIPLFTQFSLDTLFNPYLISPYTVIFTLVFAVTIAFLSTYSSAKKASQLSTIDALREYLPMESETLRKKRWPLLALILGTYKIAVFISGVNMTATLTRIMFAGGNFILTLLVGIFMIIDLILNYIGPLLFFWGFTKLFIQGSLEFQALITRAAKFLGDLGVLATKNVRRNPARAAAIAFLIALIVGYSVQVNGQLASEQDYAVRQVYYSVGADIAVNVAYASNASQILDVIMANASSSVQNATIEYQFSAFTGIHSMPIRAVEPYSWLKTAYYEGEWFSGNDVTTAFSSLASDKNTIILEINIAKSINLKIGENVSLNFGSILKKLRIVGFFGFESTQYSQYGYTGSFVSEELYNEVSGQVSASATIFLKLKNSADGKNVAENIRNLGLSISSVLSFAEKWEEAQSNIIVMGTLDVQRLGIIFAFIGASVGTALISAVSIRERSREATIMSVKGLSYKQLIIMFLTENLALVTFSVILGLFVGFVSLYGNIAASNAMISDIVRRRLVFPLDTTLMLVSCLVLIFASTILPILIMSRRYVTKLERMVRLR